MLKFWTLVIYPFFFLLYQNYIQIHMINYKFIVINSVLITVQLIGVILALINKTLFLIPPEISRKGFLLLKWIVFYYFYSHFFI